MEAWIRRVLGFFVLLIGVGILLASFRLPATGEGPEYRLRAATTVLFISWATISGLALVGMILNREHNVSGLAFGVFLFLLAWGLQFTSTDHPQPLTINQERILVMLLLWTGVNVLDRWLLYPEEARSQSASQSIKEVP